MADPHIRIFPHSKEEFPSVDSLTTWLLNGLKARGGTYHMRSSKAVKDLEAGSIVLFRYHDKIVGEGVVSNYIKGAASDKTIAGEDVEYEARTVFSPSSIRVYSPPVDIEALQSLIGDQPNIVPSAQPYFIINDWSVYPRLLALVIQQGTFM